MLYSFLERSGDPILESWHELKSKAGYIFLKQIEDMITLRA